MTFLHRLASVVRWLFHRNSAEQDLNDELQAFVDMAAADKVRDGAPPTEARRLAVLDLGWQVVLNGTSFAVRTGTDPAATTAAVRTAISEIDRDVPIDSVRTMRGVVSESVAARSFQATLLTLFGVIAVALSGIGVFGVMSYAVAQRSKELGIRLALGATPGLLQRMIVGHTLRLVGAGVALGAPIAVVAGFVLRDVLFGVRPQDPRVLVASSAVIVLVAIVAGGVPAHRVTRINPVATLRTE